MTIIKKQYRSILILLALSFFFSTSIAMADYTKVGDFYDSSFAEKEGNGQGNSEWTSKDTDPEYVLHGQTSLSVDSNQYDRTKSEYNDNGELNTESDTNVLTNDIDYEYIVLKGGSSNENSGGYAQLWKLTSDTGVSIYSKGNLIDQIGDDQPDLSHATGHNPVPIPGAIWLLGAGLLGMIGFRRFSKS